MKIDLNYKYYYIINDDLKMSKGKISAQISHVAMQLAKQYDVIGRAIVLKSNENKLKELISSTKIQPVFYIKDAGLTEVPKGSLTCVGFMENEYSKELTKEIKLL